MVLELLNFHDLCFWKGCVISIIDILKIYIYLR